MPPTERYAVASISESSASLHIWQRADGTARRTQSACKPSTSSSVASALHRGHLFLASFSSSGKSCTLTAHALSRASGGPISRSAAPEPRLTSVALAPGAGVLAAGGESGRCYLWSLVSGDMLASWDAHFRAVVRVAFSDDEATIVTAGVDASVLVFDVADLADVARETGHVVKPRLSLHGHDLPVTALAVGFGGASARVVTGSLDCCVKVWHLASGRCVGSAVLGVAVVDVALAPDEGRAFVGLGDGTVAILEVAKLGQGSVVARENLDTLAAPAEDGAVAAAVTCLSVSPRGEEVIVGYKDGKVRVFDIETRVQLLVYSKHGDVPVTWVGVLSPVPEGVLDDAVCGATAVVEGVSDGSGKDGTGRHHRGGAAEGLLFEGALRKAVEPELEQHFRPQHVFSGEGTSSWSLIDRALEMALTDGGAVEIKQ